MCELDDSKIDKPKISFYNLFDSGEKLWFQGYFELKTLPLKLTSFIWKGKNISLQSQNDPAGTIPETEMMNCVANKM